MNPYYNLPPHQHNAQRLANGIQNLILGKLLKLIP